MEFKVGDEGFCLLLSSERTLLHTHTHTHTLTQPPKQTKIPKFFLFAALEDQAHLEHCSKAKHKHTEAKQYVIK